MSSFDVSFEKGITLVPLVGSIVALTYDVGFFLAIDPSFFTFFSLSEHLVFSAQAVPLAIVIAVGSLALVAWLNSREEVLNSSVLDAGLRRKRGAKFVTLLLLVAALGYDVLFGLYEAAGFIVLVLIAGLSLSAYPSEIAKRIWTSGLFVIVVAIAFVVGAGMARVLLDAKTPTHLVKYRSGVELSGRILRAGESGILIFDHGAKRVRFLAKEEFASSERIVPSRYPSIICVLSGYLDSPCSDW